MTRQDFLNKFYLKFDKIASLALPGYEPEEIAAIATDVQEKLVLKKYNPKNQPSMEGFEETEKRVADLGELVSTAVITPLAYNNYYNVDNGVFVNLPNTYPTDVYWLPIFENVTITKKCKGKYMKVAIIETSHVELNKLSIDPFNKPEARVDAGIFRVRVDQFRHELITDGTFGVINYKIRYIRKPQAIDLTTNLTSQVSELSDIVHSELLQETINEILKDTDNPRLQAEVQTINE
jgi:hypothetical protein